MSEYEKYGVIGKNGLIYYNLSKNVAVERKRELEEHYPNDDFEIVVMPRKPLVYK